MPLSPPDFTWEALETARSAAPDDSGTAFGRDVAYRRPLHGDTALLWAAEVNGSLVPGLLALGADPKATDARGRTALMRVLSGPYWSHPRSVALNALLDAGTPIEATDVDGLTLRDYVDRDIQASKLILAAWAGDAKLTGFARLAEAVGLGIPLAYARR